MKNEMTRDEYLGLLQAIAEGVTASIAKYRQELKEQDAAAPAVKSDVCASCCTEAPVAEAVAAPAAEPVAVEPQKEDKPAKRRRTRFPLAKMLLDVLQAAPAPLSIDAIIESIAETFDADIKRSTLNVALNVGLKNGSGIVRAGRGQYSFSEAAVGAVVPTAEEVAPVAEPEVAPASEAVAEEVVPAAIETVEAPAQEPIVEPFVEG